MIRTRFAPSPTGFLHVGGVRTALFAWLVARQANGQFILRLEDTDKAREMAGSEEHIFNSLKALGLDYDEGPDKGGRYGPYKQSERLDVYRQWAHRLISSGRAYTDPYTPAEVQAFRQQALKTKKPFLYRNHRPDNPPTWDSLRPLRFKSAPRAYRWHDEVIGDLSTGPGVIDDFVLIKADGYPTYNFAHIVDDSEMAISHVIRGQEFLASIPNYLNLYEALDLKPPHMATMPHILGPDGQKKLSKRDGAKDVLDYLKEGYLPEALVSFIATLGWNDGTDQEIFTKDELIQKFSLGRVQKSPAKFDERRLLWTNGYFIRHLPINQLYEKAAGFWPQAANNTDKDFKKRVLEVTAERLKFFAELSQLTIFFFKPIKDDKEIASEISELFRAYKEADEVPKPGQWLTMVIDLIKSAVSNDIGAYEEPLKALVARTAGQPLTLYGSLRLALTGADQTPPVWQIIYALGKEESITRLQRAMSALEKKA